MQSKLVEVKNKTFEIHLEKFCAEFENDLIVQRGLTIQNCGMLKMSRIHFVNVAVVLDKIIAKVQNPQ